MQGFPQSLHSVSNVYTKHKPENFIKANNTRKAQPTLNISKNCKISEELFIVHYTLMEYKSKRILGSLLKVHYYNGIKANS